MQAKNENIKEFYWNNINTKQYYLLESKQSTEFPLRDMYVSQNDLLPYQKISL